LAKTNFTFFQFIIHQAYSNVANSDVFSPEAELKALKEELESYLKERTAIAWVSFCNYITIMKTKFRMLN
jgi:hypothetical protein